MYDSVAEKAAEERGGRGAASGLWLRFQDRVRISICGRIRVGVRSRVWGRVRGRVCVRVRVRLWVRVRTI